MRRIVPPERLRPPPRLWLGARLWLSAWILLPVFAAAGAGTAANAAAGAAEPASCRTVRFSNVGWTDITATTALTSRMLQALGYRTITQILSIPVTYASIKNRQIDVYLGDWQPSMEEDRKPFLADGSVQVVRANLVGAKYTLAVPSYVAAAGVKSFADLHTYADRFRHRIIGIEPGNNGNRMIGSIIAQNRFGLGDWTLVESSEQGMLSEVDRAIRKGDWIVFLGWSPHPMNLKYHFDYLSGGDDTFGAGYGGATIYTDVRTGYLAECPNVGTLLENLEFTPEIESRMMALILDEHLDGAEAAGRFLAAHPALLDGWLKGVTTVDGKTGAEAVRRSLLTSGLHRFADRLDAANDWVIGHKIPLGMWLNNLVEYSMHHAQRFFDAVSAALGTVITALTTLLMRVPALLLIVVLTALVGADGLGKPVVRALNSVNIAMGFEAGLAIVILAIILDRVFKRSGGKDPV